MACAEFGVTRARLRSDSQAPRVQTARRVVAWLAHCQAYDARAIGRLLRRDPATVRDMIARVDRRIDADPSFADQMIGFAGRVTAAPSPNQRRINQGAGSRLLGGGVLTVPSDA